jgi:hypothetical protein
MSKIEKPNPKFAIPNLKFAGPVLFAQSAYGGFPGQAIPEIQQD